MKSSNNMQKILFSIILVFCIAHYTYASVTIDEIMYDVPGADTGREWIEVLNDGTEPADLAEWKFFEDNANHTIADAGSGTVLAAGGRVVIADNPIKFLLDWPAFAGIVLDSAFSLSNSGETLKLKDATASIVETMTYTSSQGAAGTGESLAKLSAGWVASIPTPAEANETIEEGQPEEVLLDETPPEELPLDEVSDLPVDELPLDEVPEEIPPAEESLPEEIPDTDNEGDPELLMGTAHLVFNEIMYDAPGADTDHEWIELYNSGDGSADLLDWHFHEQGIDHRLVLISETSIVEPSGYAVIVSNEEAFRAQYPEFLGVLFRSSFSLANTGAEIVLKDPSFFAIDTIIYPAELGANGDGTTLSKIDTAWQVGSATPGSVNTLVVEEVQPVTGVGGSSDTPVFFEDNLTEKGVVRMDTPDRALPIEPLTTQQQEMLAIDMIKHEEYFYPRITNTGSADLDISELKIVSNDHIFILPAQTKIFAGASLVLGTKKARSSQQAFLIVF